MSNVQLILGDALSTVKTLDMKNVDCIIADPPYGIDVNTDYSQYPNGKVYQKLIGDSQPFDFSSWVNCPVKEQFWFGAQNYVVPNSTGSWLGWDKYPTDRSDRRLSGQFEIIWSKKRHKQILLRVKAVNTSWMTVKEAVGHPTQKPIALMKLLIEKFTKPGDTVFDPYMGSGSVGVACIQTGRNFIGVEIVEQFYQIATAQIARVQAELELVGA